VVRILLSGFDVVLIESVDKRDVTPDEEVSTDPSEDVVLSGLSVAFAEVVSTTETVDLTVASIVSSIRLFLSLVYHQQLFPLLL